MNPTDLFTAALGLSAPWEVFDVTFDVVRSRIDFKVRFGKGSRFACPACGAEGQPVHDTRPREWRHLNFFQHEAYIQADLPRVRCGQCGKTIQVEVPWARPQTGFTQLFEALVITLCRQMPVNAVAQHLNVSGDTLWRIVHHYIETAHDLQNFSTVQAVGIDETAARRGQRYITLFHDLEAGRLLYACEGRDHSTVERFAEDLRTHGGNADQISAACTDMSKAYIKGVGAYLPNAELTFDRFHVIQLANQAVDEVRRQEVQEEPLLRNSRWGFLKDEARWSAPQRGRMYTLSRMRLKTTKAWEVKESLREILSTSLHREEAETLLLKWYSWARRCRVPQMKKLATTIKAHLVGILNGFVSHLSNGRVEGINSLIQAAKARARGYRTSRSLIAIAYLIAGKLTHLPAGLTLCQGSEGLRAYPHNPRKNLFKLIL